MVTVLFDGRETDYTSTELADRWILTVWYTHSVHTIEVVIEQPEEKPAWNYRLILLAVLAAIVVLIYLWRRRDREPTAYLFAPEAGVDNLVGDRIVVKSGVAYDMDDVADELIREGLRLWVDSTWDSGRDRFVLFASEAPMQLQHVAISITRHRIL